MKRRKISKFPLWAGLLSASLLVGAVSCSSQPKYIEDERFRPWRIGAAISYHFPAFVYEAYGVNYSEDWTSLMLSYTNLTSGTRLNLDYMRDYAHNDYEGFALPLHPLINYTPSQLGLGTKTLPEELYIYWRVSNSKIKYATVVEVSNEIKAAMTRAYPHPSWRFKGQNCYQTDFLFGLLPDGRAKLWLRGCDIYTYIGTYQPSKSMPSPYAEEAENNPIPWDKVDKVWYDKKRDKMQTLADVTKELAQERKTKTQ
ncbi:DUF2931 family protein [Vibrio ponticus]|nr:DUF2931 family protein [Vibrio ponticus]